MAGLLSIALFAGQAATIPQPFQGNWATTPAACGGEDTKGVIITPTTVTSMRQKVSCKVRHLAQRERRPMSSSKVKARNGLKPFASEFQRRVVSN